ncbi:Arrestin C-terminal-like domain-containing protein [Entamoeba marina]
MTPKTKEKARIILHTDVLVLPDVLQGVIEFKTKIKCICKSIKLELRGYTTNGPDAHYSVQYPFYSKKVNAYQVNNEYSLKNINYKCFWQYSYDVSGNTLALGNVFYEYPPGLHYIPFTISISDFPHSINDINSPQSLFYKITAYLYINEPFIVISEPVPYFVVFNKNQKINIKTQNTFEINNQYIHMNLSLSETLVRIGDSININSFLINYTKKKITSTLQLFMQFSNTKPILLKNITFPDVPTRGLFNKNKQTKRFQNYLFTFHPGLFPTSIHSECTLKYYVEFQTTIKGVIYNLTCPIFLSALPPINNITFTECLLKYPVKQCDRTRNFSSPFTAPFFKEQPEFPLNGNIEEVYITDMASTSYFVDHLHRTTLIKYDECKCNDDNNFKCNHCIENEAPFPYPNWRSVLLPFGYVMYYYKNNWCFFKFKQTNNFIC